MSTKVQYFINGRLSTLWTRIRTSKLVWAILLALGAKAVEVFTEESFRTVAAFMAAVHSFYPWAIAASIGILYRSAQAKGEIASNAANPSISGVHAVEVQTKPFTGGPMVAMLLFCIGFCFVLAGCGETAAALKTRDGKPIVSGEICVQTKNGLICYKPNEPTVVAPAPTPGPTPPIATAAGPPVAVGPIAAAPLVVKQPALEK